MNYGNQGAMGGLLGPADKGTGYGIGRNLASQPMGQAPHAQPPADMGTGYGMGRNMASRPQGFAPALPTPYGNGGQFGDQGFQGQFGFGPPQFNPQGGVFGMPPRRY